jgi:GGDEF domain-containing protein
VKNRNEIDALITSGGPVVFDYIYRFPELNYAFKLNNITTENEFIYVTTSFGYTTRYSTNETFDDMFKTADDRMYVEKRMSKN